MCGLVERGGVAQGTGRDRGWEALARKPWTVPAPQSGQGGASIGVHTGLIRSAPTPPQLVCQKRPHQTVSGCFAFLLRPFCW